MAGWRWLCGMPQLDTGHRAASFDRLNDRYQRFSLAIIPETEAAGCNATF
jgi:hypothetical protein